MAKQVFHVCHRCKDRQIGCHATCKAYLKEKEENAQRLQANAERREINNALYDGRGRRLRSITHHKSSTRSK